MLDESLDIATNKKLILFCKILYDNQLRIEFCANISIQDGKAETVYNCIVNWLRDVGINVKRVSGIGTDGASVMTSCRTGVGVRMKSRNDKIVHVWCAAHRLALVSYWAAKRVPYLQVVNEMLIAIFNFYQYSAPRYAKVRELQKLMGQKVKKFKKPTQVRWLSMSDAVKACLSSYSSLILSLDHEVATAPNTEGGNKARGILRKIKCFKFLSALCLLRDILDLLDRTTKCFQKDNLDIQQLKNLINATKETIMSYRPRIVQPPTVEDMILKTDEHSEYSGIEIHCSLNDRNIFNTMKILFIDNLVKEFTDRFPVNDLGILNDFNSLLNPKLLPLDQATMRTYGELCLDNIIDIYGNTDPVIDPVRARRNFLQFKHLMNGQRDLNLTEFCLFLIKDYAETFPDYVTLAHILLTVPLTSVPCERGFSLQNRHHNATSSRRSVTNVQHRMQIEFSSKQAGYDRNEVVRQAAVKFNDDRA